MASLVADYGSESESSSSSSSSSTASDDSDSGEVDEKKVGKALPRPDFSAGHPDGQSVFVNPFAAADNAKTAILEKHVKMISTDVKFVNGRKICWNNKRNKCRFGQKCKYAHESDVQIDESRKECETGSNEKGSQVSPDSKKQLNFTTSKKRVSNDKIDVVNKKTRKT